MNNFWQSRRPLIDVFVVLAVLWGALYWYATWDKPLFFEVEIKQSGIKKYLPNGDSILGDSVAANSQQPPFDSLLAAAGGDSSIALSLLQQDNTRPSVVQGNMPPTVPLSDTSSLYILLCGDSMSEGLMFAFMKYAKFNGHQLKTRIWYSSSTKDWGKSDTLSSFIRTYRPSLILFTLGSNELFIRNPQEREPYIQNIVKAADNAGVPFVWIGPPNWKNDTGLGDLMQKTVGNDRYFLSKNMTFKRKKDGAHPTVESSAVWADSIAVWLTQHSRYKGKILLRDPKLYPNEPNRPYKSPMPDSNLIAARNQSGFKVVTAASSSNKKPVTPTKDTNQRQPVSVKIDTPISSNPKDSIR